MLCIVSGQHGDARYPVYTAFAAPTAACASQTGLVNAAIRGPATLGVPATANATTEPASVSEAGTVDIAPCVSVPYSSDI